WTSFSAYFVAFDSKLERILYIASISTSAYKVLSRHLVSLICLLSISGAKSCKQIKIREATDCLLSFKEKCSLSTFLKSRRLSVIKSSFSVFWWIVFSHFSDFFGSAPNIIFSSGALISVNGVLISCVICIKKSIFALYSSFSLCALIFSSRCLFFSFIFWSYQ